jgi:hypothetical protein
MRFAENRFGESGLSTRPSRRIAFTGEKDVDTTVDAAHLEARATRREVGTRIFMTLPVVAAPFGRPAMVLKWRVDALC